MIVKQDMPGYPHITRSFLKTRAWARSLKHRARYGWFTSDMNASESVASSSEGSRSNVSNRRQGPT